MRDKPWQVINLLTNETIEWYATEYEGWLNHKDEPIDVIYRPGRKRKVKK